MILIVSNSADFHTDAIINKINELYGNVFFRLNTEFFHRMDLVYSILECFLWNFSFWGNNFCAGLAVHKVSIEILTTTILSFKLDWYCTNWI